MMPWSRARMTAILCLLQAGCSALIEQMRSTVCQGTVGALRLWGARERSSRPLGPLSEYLLAHLCSVLLEIPNLRAVTLAFPCFL